MYSPKIGNSVKRISHYFNNLRLSFGGAVDSDKTTIDKRIEKNLGKISYNLINKNKFDYSSYINDILSKELSSNAKVFKNSMNRVGESLIESPENKSRFARYFNANEVEKNITYCSRALKVIRDSILSPDNINKGIIQFYKKSNVSEEEIEDMLSNVKNINNTVKVESYFSNIIGETLKYGDKFVEICNYKSEEVPINQSYLTENVKNKKSKRKETTKKFKVFFEQVVPNNANNEYSLDELDIIMENYKKEKLKNNYKLIEVTVYEDIPKNKVLDKFNIENRIDNILNENMVDSEFELISPKGGSSKKDDEEDETDVDDIRLILHDPTRVVKLQSEKYKMNLGYLIFPSSYKSGTKGIFGGSYTSGTDAYQYNMSGVGLQNSIIKSGIDEIYLEIIKMVKNYVNDKVKMDAEDKEELKTMLQRAIRDVAEQQETQSEMSGSQNLKIRYVPPERMEHFYINEDLYFPYGEGIYEKIMTDAKMYIALKYAITTRRVADSSDKRVINVEMTMPRLLKNSIESIKEALQKRKFSINGSDIATIPTMITNYEDYIVPVNKGKKFVEFETLNPANNIREGVEDLKYFRDEIVSGLHVPPSFVGVEDSVGNKSMLAHESSMFAELILGMQTHFSKQMFNLFSKIYKLLYNKPINEGIIITFPPPKMLYAERESEYVEVVSRLIDNLENLGVPKEYSKKKHLNVDWEEIKQHEAQEVLDKRSKPNRAKKDSNMMGL